MTLVTAVVLALVVWTVGLIRPVRVRALVYSLPIPMSLVLVGARVHVDGVQIVGVVLLVGFFAVTALLHVRWGWPVLLADVTAAAGFVVAAWALPATLPLLPCLMTACALWAAGLLLRRSPHTVVPGRPSPVPLSWASAAVKLAAVLAATFAVLGLAGLLAGLIVTFPYSGILVAVEVRHDLMAFTQHFARTAVALVAFVAGFATVQEHGLWVALVAGWLAYGVCAVALHLGSRRSSRPAGARR